MTITRHFLKSSTQIFKFTNLVPANLRRAKRRIYFANQIAFVAANSRCFPLRNLKGITCPPFIPYKGMSLTNPTLDLKTTHSKPTIFNPSGGDTDFINCELAEVLCINCQDFIGLDWIEVHSRECTFVRPEVLKHEAEDMLEGISNRISRLYNVLFALGTSSSMGPGAKNYLIIMQRLCGRLISVLELAHQSENQEVIQGLESLGKHVKSSHNLVIYLERLKALAREQKGYLDELQYNQQPKEMTLEEQLLFYKNKSQILEDALKFTRTGPIAKEDNAVEEVISDTGSRTGIFSSASSSLDSTGEIEAYEFEVSSSQSSGNLEDEQKLFYSQCLSIKLALSIDHAVQTVPIQAIYNKAMELNLLMNEWPQFIRTEILSQAGKNEPAKRLRGIKRRFFPTG